MDQKPNRWSPEARPLPLDADIEPLTKQESESSSSHPTDELELNAVIGAGTAFEGTLSFSGHIRIDGQFSGKVAGGRVLVIGQGALVSGELSAEQVIVLGGHVEASINASSSIELYIPAEVFGDLCSPQIYMDRGIKFQGTCDMTGNEE